MESQNHRAQLPVAARKPISPVSGTHLAQDLLGSKPGAYADSTASVELRGLQKLQAAKMTPLHLACANGHADVVRFLAGKKCKLNPRGMFKKTPLMLAVQHQHKDCVLALLEHGANPDHKGAGGNTALHLAAIMPSKSMVELLLEHNAHIDAQNDLGYTPLTVAVIKHREEMVEFLLQKGADANARDKRQRTILKIAVYAGNANAARLLLQHGAILSHRKDDFTYIGHLGHSTSDFSKTLEKYARSKRTEECCVGGAGGPAVAEISSSGTTAAPPVGGAAQIGAGVLPEAGAQQDEDFDSLSDFETDSEGPMEPLDAMLLPPANRQGPCAQPVAEERHNAQLLKCSVMLQCCCRFLSSLSVGRSVFLLAQVCALEREELPLKKEASTQTDRQGNSQQWVTWLQQELSNALRKNSVAEASLEAERRYSRNLQEQKLQLQKELESSKSQLQELQERLIRTECYAESLENAIKDKEQELTAAKNLQSLLATSAGTAAIPELEEHVQQLQVGMATLEATAQQQAKTIEAIQKDLQASASSGSESRELKKPSKKKQQLINAILMAAQLADFHGTGEALETTHEAGKINPGPVRSFSSLPGTQGEPVQNLASEAFAAPSVGHSQVKQSKREMGERAGQEIRQKPQEVDPYFHGTQLSTCGCSPQAVALLLTHLSVCFSVPGSAH
ncbi:ankyrin repeat domain-containing protein 20A2-like [Columba livia]|uniref:Ankyrin repeat domain-containing protein 20A2-like n=1 Tax=Columba livia TaxID=8932 RepID=A0A2I0MJ46_COLLI|nr:ankyrin repeat domain-containing protein 20A2-like [Columba livia]